ncbi:MAG TPA: hypothetical protein VD997_16875 [Phycisphaerales bacterium]|nr:hypothetical protein [Phycisphaerales bacterium]
MPHRTTALLAALSATNAALAQCTLELVDRGELAGVNGVVHSSTLWDTDGDGPLPPIAVFAGEFTQAGNAPISGVVGWDGQDWVALAPNATNVLKVVATGAGLAVRGSVAGIPTPLALWDGEAWNAVGTPTDIITDLGTDGEGNLIGAGQLWLPDGSSVGLAVWTGSAWTPLGVNPPNFVAYLTQFNGTPVALHSVFQFCGPSRFRTFHASRPISGAWQQFGGFQCIDYSPFASTVHDNQLWLLGKRFDAAFTQVTEVPYSNFWLPGFQARAMASHNGQVFVGGNLTGSQNEFHATSESSQWSSGPLTGGAINTLLPFDGSLIAGGTFTQGQGVNPFEYYSKPQQIGYHETTGIRPLRGTDGAPRFFSVVDNTLYAGGEFTSLNAGSAPLVSFDGTQWHAVANRATAHLFAAAKFNGELYVAAHTYNPIVGQLHRVTGGQTVPIGPAGPVYRDLVVHNGVLFCIGSDISQFDGASFTATDALADGAPPYALASTAVEFNGDLVVAGNFGSVAGVTASNVARRINGAWQPMGAGLFGSVNDLAISHGQLLAGGRFSLTSGGPLISLAVWNGENWNAYPDAVINGPVNAIVQRRAELVIGGNFTQINGQPIKHLAATTGGPWTALADLDAQVTALGVHGEDLHVGGRFTTLNGSPAHSYARFSTPYGCCPTSDFNNDGDIGTDQDIEAFFACLGGTCCPTCDSADFNHDGDIGTDQDIEAFFRVLGGGTC